MKAPKIFKVRSVRTMRGNESFKEGTLEELVKYFKYTLECGRSWQYEKGNKKIETNPKTIKSLISNLNKAEENTGRDYPSMLHYLVE